MKKIITILSLCCLLSSCTDTGKASYDALGKRHNIKLYSGGTLVGEWISSGKVFPEDGGAGYKFSDEKTGAIVRVQGDIIIHVINN